MKKKSFRWLCTLMLTGSLLAASGCGNAKQENTKTDTVAVSQEPVGESEQEESTAQENEVSEESISEESVSDESTSEESTAPEETAAASDVTYSSTDWKTMEFSLDGSTYQFPLSYADFESAGYVLDDSYLSEELESAQYTMTSTRAKKEDGEQIRLGFKNTGSSTVTIRDASVRAVILSTDSSGNKNTTFGLCNGIVNGDDMDTVIAAMGEEPTDRYEGSSYTSLTYKFTSNGTVMKSSIKFSFDETGLYEMELVNMDF